MRVRGVISAYDVDPESCTIRSVLSLVEADESGTIYCENGVLDTNSTISNLKSSGHDDHAVVRHPKFPDAGE